MAKVEAPNFQFKVAKHVTLPLLKMEDEKPMYVRIETPITKSAPLTGAAATGENGKKQPPELMQVVNLETGEMGQIIVNTVLGSELRKTYPNDKYVGKCFQFIRHKLQGKKYATFSITEIELTEEKKQAASKK